MVISEQQESSSDGIVARQVAFALLNSIFIQKRNLDEAVEMEGRFGKLSSRDRAFVRLLVSVVLKRTRQMDAVLQALLHEPLSELKPLNLINIFRLGIAQFAFLKTPLHAAVNTTVELAEAEGIAHHKPLVNAVMRRLTREGFPEMDDRDAGKFNTPEWLWREWMKDYGVEGALDIAAANFGEAPLDISVKGDPDQWAKRLVATALPTGSLRKTGGGFIPDMDGFAEGEWWVQNAAAALPTKLLFHPLPLGEGRGEGTVHSKYPHPNLLPEGEGKMTIVDLCAAPGGKTAQLAAMGAHVIAVDRSAERVKRLKENMERLHLNVETVVADGAVWMPKEPVDAVLLDAPCTATGTIRHQPDILHLKEPKDQEKLAALQRRLLLNAVKMLKSGGVLVYCTCSLQKAEGEEQVEWLLSQGLPIKLSPITQEEIIRSPAKAGVQSHENTGSPPSRGHESYALSELLTERGEIRALPHHWKDIGGIDGFFIARFLKI